MEKAKRERVKSAKVTEIIQVTISAGSGTENDPNRFVIEFWSKDGKLLAVSDPYVTACGPRTSAEPYW